MPSIPVISVGLTSSIWLKLGHKGSIRSTFISQLPFFAEISVSGDDVEDEEVLMPVVLPRSSKWDSFAGDGIVSDTGDSPMSK